MRGCEIVNVTFGAPRVGSARLCAACDEFVGLLSGSARLGSGAVGILLWADCFFCLQSW